MLQYQLLFEDFPNAQRYEYYNLRHIHEYVRILRSKVTNTGCMYRSTAAGTLVRFVRNDT